MDIEQLNRNNNLDLSDGASDITGEFFGALQAIRQTRKGEDGKYRWLFLCDCLNTIELLPEEVEDAAGVKHCGCKGKIKETPEDGLYFYVDKSTKPVWLTRKQLGLLMMIVPGPLGNGIPMIQACKRLGITRSSAYQRLTNFSKRFPAAWARVQALLDRMKVDRVRLKSTKRPEEGPLSYEWLCDRYGLDAVDDMVKRKF